MEVQWRQEETGMYCCPYNEGCHCAVPECQGCGWNPAVARRRNLEWVKRFAISGR